MTDATNPQPEQQPTGQGSERKRRLILTLPRMNPGDSRTNRLKG